MLQPILGSENIEQGLVFIFDSKEGHATEIARFFETDLYDIQNQLDKLETGDGVVVGCAAACCVE
jgi:hypothetical protein